MELENPSAGEAGAANATRVACELAAEIGRSYASRSLRELGTKTTDYS